MSTSTEHVWERFSGELRAFIRRRVRDADLAADLLQETFVRIHQGLDSLAEDDRVLAWVYRIARNVIADHFRETAREPAAAADEVLDAATEAGALATGSAAGAARAENYNEDVGRWLAALLPSLPEKYRAAVELAEVHGLTQEEVGRRLDLSHSGAKSRVQRGRALLARKLLDCCHLEFDRRGNVVDYARRGSCSGCCGRRSASRETSGPARNPESHRHGDALP